MGAVVHLAVSVLFLVNPLYFQEDDRGNPTALVEESTQAEGVAQRSWAVRRTRDLPVVSRYSARAGLDGRYR